MNRLNMLLMFGMLFVAMSIGYMLCSMINYQREFNNSTEMQVAHLEESIKRECYGDHYELCVEYYQGVIDGLAQTK